MKEPFKITVWGVRGSFPMSGAEYEEYGGNTSCICVEQGETILVFDAGSGLARLGDSLEERRLKKVHLLLSHLHMDHCLGLFGFRLFHDPEAEIHLYGGPHDGLGLEESLKTLLGPPYWPLGLDDFSAHVEIHELTPGQTFRLAGNHAASAVFTIHTLEGNHPDQSLYYRLESGDMSIIYALDCETDEKTELSLAEFAGNGSLLIWDANFTEKDLARRRGWGHSTWNQGVELRRKAGVKAALMTHFSSEYTDAFLREQEALCTKADPASRFAREGMSILLTRQDDCRAATLTVQP